ncbi:hypothetical protein M3175_17855 [Robertmurraya korlensis]|uniref:hypothetical protein n=1 Tax=Robertmurraya korlensis TaxID=519977 RepID=UPI002040D6C2|nr:hypothetical protein [Robertmurraya korlensis]MCM3602601.1 hypothetical protein [Robertmurraya korlensis]
MVESMIDYALGPHGRFLSEYYMQYQFPINSAVFAIAVYRLTVSKLKKRKLQNATRATGLEDIKVD